MRRLDFVGDFNTIFYDPVPQMITRIVKPNRFVLSRGDALGFAVHPKYKESGRRIRVVDSQSRIFHYGRVFDRERVSERSQVRRQLWGERTAVPGLIASRTGDESESGNCARARIYRSVPRESVRIYTGNHPRVMSETVSNDDFSLNIDDLGWRAALTPHERRAKWLQQISSALRLRFQKSYCYIER